MYSNTSYEERAVSISDRCSETQSVTRSLGLCVLSSFSLPSLLHSWFSSSPPFWSLHQAQANHASHRLSRSEGGTLPPDRSSRARPQWAPAFGNHSESCEVHTCQIPRVSSGVFSTEGILKVSVHYILPGNVKEEDFIKV